MKYKMESRPSHLDYTRDWCKLREEQFHYVDAHGKHTRPNVLITSENQHQVRGFNVSRSSERVISMIQKEWNKIQNQPWSTKAKESILISRVPQAANLFRTYKSNRMVRNN